MATVAVVGTPTWNTTGGDTTVVATPVYGDLIIIVAGTSGLAGGTTAVSDNVGDSATYTQVDSDRTGFSTTGVLTVWVRSAPIRRVVSTTFTASQATSTGGGLAVLALRDGGIYFGAAAVLGNGGQSTGTAGTTPAPVLSRTPLASNPIITAVMSGTNGGGTAVRAGYTDVSIGGYNTPATGFDLCYLNSGETSATITWGGTIATAFASVAIEVDATTPTYQRSLFEPQSFPPGRLMPRKPLVEALTSAVAAAGNEYVETGSLIAGVVLAGADVFEAAEAGSLKIGRAH